MTCLGDTLTVAGATTGHTNNNPGMIYNACALVEAAQIQQAISGAVSAVWSVVQLKFAADQKELAERTQDRLDEIHAEQLALAKDLRGQYESSMSCELEYMQEACSRPVQKPDYNAIRGRVSNEVSRQFKKVRDNLDKCLPRYCLPMLCHERAHIDAMEAQAKALAVESAYRIDEGLFESRLGQKRTDIMTALQHMRGNAVQAGNAFNSAATIAIQSGNINPNEAFNDVGNTILGRINGFLANQTAIAGISTYTPGRYTYNPMYGQSGGQGGVYNTLGQPIQSQFTDPQHSTIGNYGFGNEWARPVGSPTDAMTQPSYNVNHNYGNTFNAGHLA